MVASPWVKRITFVRENVLRRQDSVDLQADCIYYVYVGKLVLGKRIVEESEFIFGSQGR